MNCAFSLGVLDELAADDLLQLKQTIASGAPNPTLAAAFHFFAIVRKLPMELQMILCHRTVGSMKQNILHQYSEAAFKALARILT